VKPVEYSDFVTILVVTAEAQISVWSSFTGEETNSAPLQIVWQHDRTKVAIGKCGLPLGKQICS